MDYFLYLITNTVNGKQYYGISNNVKRRWNSHKCSARSNGKSAIHCAMRKHGIENFKFEIVQTFTTKEACQQAEIDAISKNKNNPNYNIHAGGEGGFSMKEHSPEKIQEWKNKLKIARSGAKPALGLKHTDKTKSICGEFARLRWDAEGRYNKEDVLKLGFTAANKTYGISKTHYYRLKNSV